MREILFRGKNIHNKWVYGHYCTFKESEDIILHGVVPILDDTNEELDDLEVTINHATLGQFTGYKDKHGTKIFEGDIIEFHFTQAYSTDGTGMSTSVIDKKETHTMFFEGGSFRCGSYNYAADMYPKHGTVIGNIHTDK